jgi:hypothetical protein
MEVIGFSGLKTRMGAAETDIGAEAEARESADTALRNDLTAEASAREDADTALREAIDDLVPGEQSSLVYKTDFETEITEMNKGITQTDLKNKYPVGRVVEFYGLIDPASVYGGSWEFVETDKEAVLTVGNGGITPYAFSGDFYDGAVFIKGTECILNALLPENTSINSPNKNLFKMKGVSFSTRQHAFAHTWRSTGTGTIYPIAVALDGVVLLSSNNDTVTAYTGYLVVKGVVKINRYFTVPQSDAINKWRRTL